jgi:hypothetical protein
MGGDRGIRAGKAIRDDKQMSYIQQLCCVRGNAGDFLFSIAVE